MHLGGTIVDPAGVSFSREHQRIGHVRSLRFSVATRDNAFRRALAALLTPALLLAPACSRGEDTTEATGTADEETTTTTAWVPPPSTLTDEERFRQDVMGRTGVMSEDFAERALDLGPTRAPRHATGARQPTTPSASDSPTPTSTRSSPGKMTPSAA